MVNILSFLLFYLSIVLLTDGIYMEKVLKLTIILLILFSAACSNTVASEADQDFVKYDETVDTDLTADLFDEASDTDTDVVQVSICEKLETVAEKYINTDSESGKAIGLIVQVESSDISETCTFGSKVKGGKTIPTGNEQWVIGSVSKMLTSFIFTQKAVDDTKLLEDSAENYLPENWSIPKGSGEKKFTMTHLMTHTSGLPHYPDTLQESIDNVSSLDDMYAAWEGYTMDDLESDLGVTDLSFDPGKAYLYSDFGFALVQKATEMLYEKTFPEVLEEFSNHMGLNNTIVPEDLSEDQKSDLFYGHGGALAVPMEKPVVTPVFTGDGFIYSDAEDMGRLLRVFAGIDDVPDENVTKTLEILTEERFPRNASGTAIAQGLGIGVITQGDFKLYKKNGTSAGTTTAFLWDKKNKLGVVVAGNVIPFGEGVNKSACEIYSILAKRSDITVPPEVAESCEIAF